MSKKSFCFFIISFISILLFGNIRKDSIGDWQKAYRDALYYYDSAEYGKALNCAEDAILFRKQQIEYESSTLKESLSSRAVHVAGDNIKDILTVLGERMETKSIDIIESYINKKGYNFFDNSIKNLLNYMDSLKVFPEAQKLIGDIYKLEGEYKFAENYYLMALKNADVLDIPNEKYEILYLLAEISEFEKDYDSYEIRLLNILGEDKNYKNKSLRNAMINTIKGNSKECVEKFFKLYRADSELSLNAYIKLSEYYFSINQNEKALELSALAVITSFTKISKSLESRNLEYYSNSLSDFLQECSLYDDIVEWGSKNNVWKCFSTFTKITIKNGYNDFAKAMLKVLVQYLPEPYWQKDVVLTLEMLEHNNS